MDLRTGAIVDVVELGILDPTSVIEMSLSQPTDAAVSVLRVDDVLWAQKDPTVPEEVEERLAEASNPHEPRPRAGIMDVPTGMEAWTKVEDRPGGFELRHHPVPVPGPGEVLVRTRSTSICGTDLHIWSWDEWSRSNVDLGTITGHETSGMIVALVRASRSSPWGIGSPWNATSLAGVAHDVRKAMPTSAIMGRSSGCIPMAHSHPISRSQPPMHVPSRPPHPILASIQDPLGNAIHTLTGGPIEGATVAVHGLGPIGLFAVNAAKAMGAAQVIAVDWDNRFRMDLAMDLGADLVLGKSHDVVKSILEATEGRGVDNSCEFSGITCRPLQRHSLHPSRWLGECPQRVRGGIHPHPDE